MVFRVHFVTFLVIFTASDFRLVDGLLSKYVPLITDVHKYYGTSSVFFLLSSNDRRLQEYALVHMLFRDFSKQGVVTLTIDFENVHRRTHFYRRRIVRPLMVVVLKSVRDITEFVEHTEDMNKSYPIWLVIFADEFSNRLCKYCNRPMGNIFNLRFNVEMLVVCCDNPMLKEWWSVHRNRTEIADFATWNKNEGLTLHALKGLYARRNNVNGTELRIAIVTDSALVQDYGDKIGGLFGNIVHELSRVMNFKIISTLRERVFGSWSSTTESWSGVIGQLARREADIGVAEFSMSNARLDVVDFTVPLLTSRSRLYMRAPDGLGVQWSAYFKTFRYEIWLAIIVLLMTTSVLLTVITVRRGSIPLPYLIAENYLYVWGIFCQQGLSEFPAETPLRIAYVSVFGSALVVSAAYSAALISFLTVSSAALPFSTMTGFANDGSYKLIVFRNSADYDFFATSSDPVVAKMMILMKPWEDLPISLEEGFEQVSINAIPWLPPFKHTCEKNLDYFVHIARVCKENVAFYTSEAVKKTIDIYLKCNVASIESGRTDSLAMTALADSEYTGILNYHLSRFRDNGMLFRLKQKYFIKGNPEERSYHSVSVWSVAPILSVLSIGIIVAVGIFFFEKICKTLTNLRRESGKRENSNKPKMHRWLNFHGMSRS